MVVRKPSSGGRRGKGEVEIDRYEGLLVNLKLGEGSFRVQYYREVNYDGD